MLEARNLEATRGEVALFRGVAFTLHPGALLRVAGANGSGKTSLLRILCGLLAPSEGEVRWRGEPIRNQREAYGRELAHIGHHNALKDDLSARENLIFSCALCGIRASPAQAQAALERMGLPARSHLPARALSQGQRRRVALARLLLSETAPLWILDEPFAALDAAGVGLVQSLIAAHLARGGLGVLTTHQEARIEAASATDINLDVRSTA
jgi:heme exporter protein A